MKPVVMKFGLIAGAMLSALMLATLPFMDQIGFDYGALVGYTGMVLAFLMVFFGVRSYRDTVGDGQVSFGRAFSVGLLITVVASCCYVATWQFVYRTMATDFMDKYAAHELAKAKKAGATEARLAEQRKDFAEFAEMYKNPLVSIGMTLLEPLPVGFVFTLVSAGVLSRRRKAAESIA